MRVCKSCLKELDDSEFYKHSRCKDGINPRCKKCVKNKENTKEVTKIEKVCTKCEVLKPMEDFAIAKSKKDGRTSRCKQCTRASIDIIPAGFKRCKKCEEIKSKNSFRKRASSKDGVDTRCISCKSNKRPKGRQKRFKDTEESKTCTMCKVTKNVCNFYKNKNAKDGLTSNCKECRSFKIDKKWQKEYNKKYKENNREKLNEKASKYISERLKTDTNFKIKTRIRESLKRGLDGLRKSRTTQEILNCTFEEFKVHIESQFLPWMNWDNYGKCITNEYNCSWHLDHIVPISIAKTEEEIYILNHWSNFQPLCGKVNCREKQDKIPIVCNVVSEEINNLLKQFL